MASQKPLLIPWLIEKIDSQMYPGVDWSEGKNKTEFRLPWKHGSRQDLCADDFKIFEDWAIVSGCYDPKSHKPDPARWKRNFRSALNQKDSIHLITDNSAHATDPHKVFKITRKDTELVPSEQCVGTSGMLAFGFSGNQIGDTVQPHQMFIPIQIDQLHKDNAAIYCDLEDFQNALPILDTVEPVQEIDCHYLSSQVPTEGVAVYYEDANAVGDGAEAGQIQAVQEDTFQQQILRHFTYNSFETDFEVNIYYRGTKVKSTMVTNPFGFCLTSRQQPLPSSYAEDVTLPQAQEKVTNQLLIQSVNCILATLDQGTQVLVRDMAICAKRSGKCRSFWAITDTPTTVLPSQIDKHDYSVLYTLQQFVTELIEFVEKRRKDSPQYSIWICLGEAWPDGNPWRKKCIMVEIIPMVMRLLHELSYKAGASSLSNSDLNLEISDSLSDQSAVLSLLRNIEERMCW
ncbi:interferon regulatory factor 3-like isoform X1 [Pyxicephalus adspersus]|uniref:interferon regulatory factor 3-like isoform X1 n=1 Tax=Pyxicephalus adspersus TaxID=30357 RepID=UPI003B5C384B